MKRWRRWLKRGLIGTFVTLAGLAVVGYAWQSLASAADRRNFPPPGKLVDVGGHRLHLQCAGQGAPTVVLDVGAFGVSSSWAWIQPAVAAHTRVCAYDRAGLGWSEPGPEPRDAASIARELHTLLQKAGEAPPYVLAGHSYGGMLNLMYAEQYPQNVGGMLLLDSSHPDEVEIVEKAQGKRSSVEKYFFEVLAIAARFGVMRLIVRHTEIVRPFDDLPPKAASEARMFLSDSTHVRAGMAEMRLWYQSAAQVRAARRLGDMPLVVISAGEMDAKLKPLWYEMHRELAALSTRSSHRIIEGSNHVSMLTTREHASQLADAIRETVEVARARATQQPQ